MGTVEGRAESASIHGRNVLRLWDPLTGQAIECHFPDTALDQVREAFGRRVQVAGPVRYNALGRPCSVQLERLRVFREQSELPQARDLEGIDITGGADPTEYIRRLRHGGRKSHILG